MFKMEFLVLTSFLLGSLQVNRVSSYNLTIRADHVRISDAPQSVSVNCYAGLKLTGCQIRWRDHWGRVGPLLDLSRGAQSRPDPAHLDGRVTGYSYSGRGLALGDCGVSLQLKGYKKWMVGCRVRGESGGWKYAWTDLYAAAIDTLSHTLTPGEVVVLPAGEARIMLAKRMQDYAPQPLDSCGFNLPGVQRDIILSRGAESADSTGRHRYLGTGVWEGECGLVLTNISEADNGPARGWVLGTGWTSGDHRYITIIVARPPTAPTLNLEYTDTGVTATCEVKSSRPIATISWYLGDDVIREDSDDDSQATVQDGWRWPWMAGSVLQRLTKELQPQDSGKHLTCRVSHVSLSEPLDATEIVTFA